MTIVLAIASFILLVYILVLIPVCIEFFISQKKNINVDLIEEKKISVLIPVRNEAENILSCLESLSNQNYSNSNFEIIVINDNSTDDTVAIVNQFISSNPDTQIQLINLENEQSKKKALELGVKHSKYNIIATTDADCLIPQNWLHKINANFDENTSLLIGPVRLEKSSGFLLHFQSLDMLAMQGISFGMLGFGHPILNNAANLVYEKVSYQKVDGYDKLNTPSGDDLFLLEKFKAKNFKIKGVLDEDFIVETISERTWKGFINQRLRWSSKTKHSKNFSLITLGFVIVLLNISLIFIYIALPFVENYRNEMLIFLSCKWLIDFILLFLVASFFKRRGALFYFFPVQILYPFYIVFVWIASLKGEFEWKGRKFNG